MHASPVRRSKPLLGRLFFGLPRILGNDVVFLMVFRTFVSVLTVVALVHLVNASTSYRPLKAKEDWASCTQYGGRP